MKKMKNMTQKTVVIAKASVASENYSLKRVSARMTTKKELTGLKVIMRMSGVSRVKGKTPSTIVIRKTSYSLSPRKTIRNKSRITIN